MVQHFLASPIPFGIPDFLFQILASEQHGREEKKIVGVLYLMCFNGHLL